MEEFFKKFLYIFILAIVCAVFISFSGKHKTNLAWVSPEIKFEEKVYGTNYSFFLKDEKINPFIMGPADDEQIVDKAKKDDKVKSNDKKIEKKETKKLPSTLPNFKIDGILFSETLPLVNISGNFYTEGDSFKGVKIVKIYRDKVVFMFNDKKYTKKIQTPEIVF